MPQVVNPDVGDLQPHAGVVQRPLWQADRKQLARRLPFGRIGPHPVQQHPQRRIDRQPPGGRALGALHAGLEHQPLRFHMLPGDHPCLGDPAAGERQKLHHVRSRHRLGLSHPPD